MYYYEVIPTKIFRHGADFLTYHSSAPLTPHTIILVEVGKTPQPALVYQQVKKPSFPTKPIIKSITTTPLPPHLIKSLDFLNTYYLTPLPLALATILPPGIDKLKLDPLKTNLSAPNSFFGGLAEQSAQAVRSEAERTPASVPPKRSIGANTLAKENSLTLTPSQQSTLDQIIASTKKTILLHGRTGSGKTALYLKLSEQIICSKKSILLLLPEIALTAQLNKIFIQHFGPIVTILHSNQTPKTRRDHWVKIAKTTTPQIIIGPRSALFAPIQDLGLIIIDEAHEPAYHQDQNPKYSALRLASAISPKVILGTATPNLIDYALAKNNTSLFTLPDLAIKNSKTTKLHIIDQTNPQNFAQNKLFSTKILQSIEQNIQNNHLTMVFHNRRGSAPITICTACGWQALCPTCLLPITLHADRNLLVCHSCGYTEPPPYSCPTCKTPNIVHKGIGTKTIEQELTKLFPTSAIARFDKDSDSQKTIEKEYQNIQDGRYNIIIGTQTIAKGFDFPHLKTLIIPSLEHLTALPDYSTTERAHQLLTQVIGRAHRGHTDTDIFIQSYQPDQPLLKTLNLSDPIKSYEIFADALLKERAKSHNPPYSHLLKLTLTTKTEPTVIKNITKLQKSLEKTAKAKGYTVSNPYPALHEKTATGYHWHLTLRAKSRQTLLAVLKTLQTTPNLTHTLDPNTLL